MTEQTVPTVEDLQVLLRDQEAFKKAFRKTDQDPNRVFKLQPNEPKNWIEKLLQGQFKEGRLPYIRQVTLPDGSQIRLKFYNTIKRLYNSKNVELIGKESFLSYLEISVLPTGSKGYFYTTDVNQIVWGTSKSKAEVKHNRCLKALKFQAEALGIDLDVPGAWATQYTENY